jgi:hypothetical protein
MFQIEDENQFSLLVEMDDKGLSMMPRREGKRKCSNLDVEQYFVDGLYACPNLKCDRK